MAVTSWVELTVEPTKAVSRKLTIGAPPFAPTVQLTVAAESKGVAETAEAAAGTVFAASAAVLSPSDGSVAAARSEHGHDWAAKQQRSWRPNFCSITSSQ